MYNLKIINCGDRIEIYKVNNYVINEGEKEETQLTEDNDSRETQSKKDRCRSLNDARNNIIRLIKCNPDMQTFITLTFSKEQDYKESKKSLDASFHKLRRDIKNFKYLWVLEYGDKRKRLHYHVLCNYPVNINLSDRKHKKSEEHKALENNFKERYWPYGWVFIRHLGQENNMNIALYVSTYIVKSLLDINLEGYRIYSYSSKTLEKPVVTKIYSKQSIEEILSQFKEYEIKYSNSYGIGYDDYLGDHKGQVNYYDIERRKENEVK